jgi:DHA1 family multidrug resistance protein-like MFS transporter
MVMPFLPVFLGQLGLTQGVEFWSGLIIAVSSACSMVVSPVWGAVGDRYGRRLMLLRGGVFLTLAYVLIIFVKTPTQLLLVRMMVGLLTGFVPMAIALVGVSTPQAEVAVALGVVQTAWPSGAIIGPIIGGAALDLIGVRGSSLVSAVLMAIVTLLVMLAVREDFTRPDEVRRSILSDLRVAAGHRLLMSVVLINAISSAAVMALEPVLVPFVQQIAGQGAPGWLAGLLYAIPGGAFILMAPWWARRGDRVGYARTVATGMIFSGLLFIPQALVRSPWQLGVLRVGFGVTGAAIGPGIAALLATQVPRGLRGRAFGLNQAAAAAGSIFGPLFGGWIGSYISARMVFVLIALLYLAGFAWVKWVVEPRVGPPEVRVIEGSG